MTLAPGHMSLILILLVLETGLCTGAVGPAPSVVSALMEYYGLNHATVLLSSEVIVKQEWDAFKSLVNTSYTNSMQLDGFETDEVSSYGALNVLVHTQRTSEILNIFIKMTETQQLSFAPWVLFFGSTFDLRQLESAKIPFDAEVLIARILDDTEVRLEEVYRVTPQLPLRIKFFGNWTALDGLSVDIDFFYARRNNLEGVLIKTGSTENWPITTFKGTQYGYHWDGYYPRVWRTLQNILNFTTSHERAVETGDWNDKGRSTVGLAKLLTQGDIDIILSEFKMTKERLRYVDFTYPLVNSKYQVYFRLTGYGLSWSSVLEPFGRNVWLAVVAWILLGALALSTCHYCHLLLGGDTRGVVGPTEAFFFMVQSLCQQGSSNVPKSEYARCIFLMSYLLSAVLVPSYSASLVSFLTFHVPSRPFNSLEEMLLNGRYRLIVEKDTAEYTMFSDATDPLYSEVYNNLILPISESEYPGDIPTALDMVCREEGFALFGVQSTVDYIVSQRPWDGCTIMTFSSPLQSLSEAFALAKNHPFTDLLNYQLIKLDEVGVILQVLKSIWIEKKEITTSNWASVDPSDVFLIFILLVVGLMISVVILCIEMHRSKQVHRVK